MIDTDILEKKLELTELGKTIPLPLLLTHSNAYIITFVLYAKKCIDENKETLCKDLYEQYFTNSNGNLGYMDHVLHAGVKDDLFYLVDIKT